MASAARASEIICWPARVHSRASASGLRAMKLIGRSTSIAVAVRNGKRREDRSLLAISVPAIASRLCEPRKANCTGCQVS